MGEAVMFLSCPGTRFEIIDAADILPPFGFTCLRFR